MSADFFGRKDVFFTCDQIIQVCSKRLLSHTLLSMKQGKNDFFKVSKKQQLLQVAFECVPWLFQPVKEWWLVFFRNEQAIILTSFLIVKSNFPNHLAIFSQFAIYVFKFSVDPAVLDTVNKQQWRHLKLQLLQVPLVKSFQTQTHSSKSSQQT